MKRKAITVIATTFALALGAASADAAPGDLDGSFGAGGFAVHDLEGGAGDDYARDAAVQPDGKIVVAGVADPVGSDTGQFLVARFMPDGSPDPSFGDAGRTLTSFANGFGRDEAHALAFDSQGRIVVAGESDDPGSDRQFAVARYLPDGDPDPTFGSAGRLRFTFIGSAGDDRAYAVAVDGDEIVAAGRSSHATDGHRAAIARMGDDGTLDTTFDTDGRRTISNTGHSASIADLIHQPDGKLVAVGTTREGTGKTELGLYRFESNGGLDSGFAGDGIAELQFGQPDTSMAVSFGTAVVREPGGALVVTGGRKSPNGTEAGLARFHADGQFDDSFSDDGQVLFAGGSQNGAARDLARQPDGKLVVAGYIGGADTAVFRFTPGGDLDGSFAGDGTATRDAGTTGEDGADAVALQPDGRIVTAGSAGAQGGGAQDTAVARWLGGPRPVEPQAQPPVQPPAGPLAPPRSRQRQARCANRIKGTRRADRLTGTAGPDRIDGRGGKDVLRGRGGKDCLIGGAGKDRLSGGTGDDVLKGGVGSDKLAGGGGRNSYGAGAGNDRISARNGIREVVNCGRGRDIVKADRSDRLRGCERVNGRSTR
jgi:uncharacterized delta-60 repeat protein